MNCRSLIVCALLTSFASLSYAADLVSVDFVATVPKDTPADTAVLLVGNSKELGRWNPENGVKLERRKDGKYAARVSFVKNRRVEYKLCLGSWRRPERTADGGDRKNREITPTQNETVDIEVPRWGDGRAPRRTTSITGTVKTHAKVKSKFLELPRDVFVYLPPGYVRNTDARYPVLYMHDGQNLFDRRRTAFGVEWGIDETAQRLILAKRIEEIIVVGVSNTRHRTAEYTMPAPSLKNSDGPDTVKRPKSRGDRYARFLVEELKPFIDETYRTKTERDHTAIGGSSLGGLISLYIASKHPKVFAKCAVVSAALAWNQQQILKQVERDGAWMRRARIWLDMGTSEARTLDDGTEYLTVKNTRKLVEIFDQWELAPGRDYYYSEIQGGTHDEAAWASRADKILLFLFAPRGRAER
ncbi:MAG: alpha/beta hydrolase-fold protein [Planctomycetota bacterium]